MNERFDRYINNDLKGYVSRPQYEISCSVTALTAFFNYLYADNLGIIRSIELANVIGITAPKNVTGFGNSHIMRFFDKLCRHYGVLGDSAYFLRSADVKDFSNNAQVFGKIKTAIHNPDTALIYHTHNHYTLIVGYFKHAVSPDDAYNPHAALIRWLVLGEHSEYSVIPNAFKTVGEIAASFVHKKSSYNQIMERATSSPIWSRRWKDVRYNLLSSGNHCVMGFNKRVDKGS
jgi:hypothetical protein